MSKLLKLCLIVLLLICSKNLFGQTNDTTSLRGNADSLVVIDIGTLREANVKLIERLALKDIVSQQDTIILNQFEIISKYKSENINLVSLNENIKKQYLDAEKLNKDLTRNLKNTKIAAYTLGGVSVITIGYILINIIVHGK